MTTEPLDLAIPAGILRRLESVDADLSVPTALAGASRPSDLHLVPARVEIRSRRLASASPRSARPAVLAASMLVALLATVTLVGMPGVRVGGASQPSAPLDSGPGVVPSTPPSVVPSAAASTAPTPEASPSGTPLEPVRVVRADAPARTLLGKELRASCLDKGVEPGPSPDKMGVLAAAGRRTAGGWLDDTRTVWLGSEPRAAAEAFRARVLVIGADSQWIIPADEVSSARRLLSFKARTSNAYWLGTRVNVIPCG